MQINILTLFPEFFSAPLQESILKRAQQTGRVVYRVINLRDFTSDRHQTADDRPFGGGPGMVMMVEPIDKALQSLGEVKGTPNHQIVLTSAKGSRFAQKTAQDWSKLESLTIICGHYEGVDERVVEHLIDAEVRIGDFVLTGGEPAALVMADAVTRLLPGALGNAQSTADESHTIEQQAGIPQYTRPENYKGWQVPPVVMSGHHAQITAWRAGQKKLLQD
jgi:tRNA (guanine37-N1)-methyltransferase